MAKWVFLLFEFEIAYMTQKAVKGQIIVYYLAGNPIIEDWAEDFKFPDEAIISIDTDDE